MIHPRHCCLSVLIWKSFFRGLLDERSNVFKQRRNKSSCLQFSSLIADVAYCYSSLPLSLCIAFDVRQHSDTINPCRLGEVCNQADCTTRFNSGPCSFSYHHVHLCIFRRNYNHIYVTAPQNLLLCSAAKSSLDTYKHALVSPPEMFTLRPLLSLTLEDLFPLRKDFCNGLGCIISCEVILQLQLFQHAAAGLLHWLLHIHNEPSQLSVCLFISSLSCILICLWGIVPIRKWFCTMQSKTKSYRFSDLYLVWVLYLSCSLYWMK